MEEFIPGNNYVNDDLLALKFLDNQGLPLDDEIGGSNTSHLVANASYHDHDVERHTVSGQVPSLASHAVFSTSDNPYQLTTFLRTPNPQVELSHSDHLPHSFPQTVDHPSSHGDFFSGYPSAWSASQIGSNTVHHDEWVNNGFCWDASQIGNNTFDRGGWVNQGFCWDFENPPPLGAEQQLVSSMNTSQQPACGPLVDSNALAWLPDDPLMWFPPQEDELQRSDFGASDLFGHHQNPCHDSHTSLDYVAQPSSDSALVHAPLPSPAMSSDVVVPLARSTAFDKGLRKTGSSSQALGSYQARKKSKRETVPQNISSGYHEFSVQLSNSNSQRNVRFGKARGLQEKMARQRGACIRCRFRKQKCVRQNLDDACEGCFPALSTGATEVNGIRLTAPITKFSDFIDLLDSTEVNGIRLATHLTKVSQLLHLLELTDWPSFITRGPPGEGEVLPTPVTDNNAVTVLDRLDWLMKWKTLQQAASKHPDKVFMAIILLARLEDAAGNLPHLPEIILHFWKLIIYALRCPGIDARDCKLVFAVHNFDERKAEDGTEYWQWIGAVPRGRASRTIPERATFQVRLLFYSRTSLLMLTLIGDCRVDIRRIVGGDTRENQAWQLWSKMPL